MKQARPYVPGILLFLFALVMGALVYRDYGMSWDEPFQRTIGNVNYNYVFNHDPSLLTFQDKEYGPAFELPLIFIEKWLHLTDTRDIYFMRHIATHIFFLVGVFCVYVLVYRLFRNQFLACLAFIMIVLMPRLYAHSFFNTKDIPFLSALIICMTICQAAFRKRKPFLFLLLGAACGISGAIRMMALLPSLMICGFLVIDVVDDLVKKKKTGNGVASLLLFIGGFCISIYAIYPFLWSGPVHNFAAVVSRMFRKDFCGWDLINGKLEISTSLPWFYLPEWFAITIPVLWLAAGVIGILLFLIHALRKPALYITNTPQRNFLLYCSCFLAPVLSVIVFKSIIYDEWRHLYFIYPFFVLMAIYFLDRLSRTRWWTIVQAACVVQVLATVGFMIKYHPFQQVYFNSLVSHKDEYLRRNFEFDYWGVSAKQALNKLITDHPTGIIKVGSPIIANYISNNIMLLKPNDRERIQLTAPEDCDYFITNFRADHMNHDPQKAAYAPKVLNSTIIGVYKMHE